MYRRFGSEVTVLEHGPKLVGREDPDVSDTLREILKKEQVAIQLNSDIRGVEKSGDGVGIRTAVGVINGSHLLLATGRRPNTDDLGLENTGIRMNEHGYIQVDDELKTSVENVWALGTAMGAVDSPIRLITILKSLRRICWATIRRRVSDRITAYAMFIGSATRARRNDRNAGRGIGRPALIGKRDMTRVGRAIEKSETQGFMKILVDAGVEVYFRCRDSGHGRR